MRYTVGTVSAVTVGLLLISAFWQNGPEMKLAPVVEAQQHAAQEAAPTELDAATTTTTAAMAAAEDLPFENPWRKEVEEKLSRKTIVDFLDTPLSEVLVYISEQVDLPILVDAEYLNDRSVDVDQTVNITIQGPNIRVRTALELIFERLRAPIGFSIRDGVVVLTNPAAISRTEIYNCRDLVDRYVAHHLQGGEFVGQRTAGAEAGGGFFQVGLGGAFGSGPSEQGGSTGGDEYGGQSAAGGCSSMHPRTVAADSLVDMIENTVYIEGEGASISHFDGLVVVRTTDAAHREIAQLLAMLRRADLERSYEDGGAE